VYCEASRLRNGRHVIIIVYNELDSSALDTAKTLYALVQSVCKITFLAKIKLARHSEPVTTYPAQTVG
jgi:hypothetical protein